MPVSPNRTQRKAAGKPALAQESPRIEIVDARDFDSMLDKKYGVQTVNDIPDLDHSIINLIGKKGSGKSELIAGSDRMTILRFTDDHTMAVRRCLARLEPVSNLNEFEDKYEMLISLAQKYGPESPRCQVGLDSIYVLSDLLLEREMDYCNAAAEKDYNYAVSKGRAPWGYSMDENGVVEAFRPYKSIRDVPNSEKLQYPKVAKVLGGLVLRFKSYGWGVVTVTHRKPGITANEDGRGVKAEMKSKLPGSHAAELADIADVNMVVVKEVRDNKPPCFVAEFQSPEDQTIGARVPMEGSVQLPNYGSFNTGGTATGWQLVREAYNRARESLTIERDEFQKAVHDR